MLRQSTMALVLAAMMLIGCGQRRASVRVFGGPDWQSAIDSATIRRDDLVTETKRSHPSVAVECDTYAVTSEGAVACSNAAVRSLTADRLAAFCTSSVGAAETEMCREFVRGQHPADSPAHPFKANAPGYGTLRNCGPRDRWRCGHY